MTSRLYGYGHRPRYRAASLSRLTNSGQQHSFETEPELPDGRNSALTNQTAEHDVNNPLRCNLWSLKQAGRRLQSER
ncbi:hypothetical protein E4U23_002709 [Claviceps purpurea]|nr:hypothetical protein E4U10_007612 [Claviceps purpurea]KAG6248821.1 hypothetical protein E4U23_002709 [Claviceps purpurea]